MAQEGLLDNEIRQSTVDRMHSGTPPLAAYKKAILARVLVRYLDPIRMVPSETILRGNPDDPDEEETWVIKVWSPAEDNYLRRFNKSHFKDGTLIPYTPEAIAAVSVNQVSDDEIELILQKPHFTLKNKLAEFTSPVPVRRFLLMAEKMNRPIGTINHIKGLLEKMETNTDENTEGGVTTVNIDY